MALQFEFDTRPISPGEGRYFTLTSASPARVAIRCFVSSPPPPGYRPCAECGTFAVRQGQTIRIEASLQVFPHSEGGLDITVTDEEGDVVSIRLEVTSEDPDHAAITVASMG